MKEGKSRGSVGKATALGVLDQKLKSSNKEGRERFRGLNR